MDKLTIKTDTTVLTFNTQSLLVSLVDSVNGKIGIVTLNAQDVGADLVGAAAAVQQNLDDAVDLFDQQLDSLENGLSVLSSEVDAKANASAVVQALSTKADLVDGVVPASQLPSYVDDVLNGTYVSETVFNNEDGVPYTPESGKIYIDIVTNKTYRWSGSAYVVVSDTIALGETSSTAYRGDRGKMAFDHSQSQGNAHNMTTNDLPEGARLYFTPERVRTLTLVTFQSQPSLNTPILFSDTITSAFSKTQSQIDAIPSKVLATKLTGLFPFNDTPIFETDDILGGFSKAQSQINALKTVGWINATSITGFSLHAVASQNAIPLKFAKKDGMLWISGALNVGYLQTGLNLFTFTNNAYLVERFIAADLIVNTFRVTVYYQDVSGPIQATMDAYLFRNASNMTLRLQYQLPNNVGATIVVFNPMPLGRLINP